MFIEEFQAILVAKCNGCHELPHSHSSLSQRLSICRAFICKKKRLKDQLHNELPCVMCYFCQVHERSVQSDFLLIVLRNILEKRRNFKVILMSATVDSDKFSSYFQHCPVFHIPGKMFPVEVNDITFFSLIYARYHKA